MGVWQCKENQNYGNKSDIKWICLMKTKTQSLLNPSYN